jgi:hypothetical protein
VLALASASTTHAPASGKSGRSQTVTAGDSRS